MVIAIVHVLNSAKTNGCYTIYCTGQVGSENKELPCRGLQNPTIYALDGIEMDMSNLKTTSKGKCRYMWGFCKDRKNY